MPLDDLPAHDVPARTGHATKPELSADPALDRTQWALSIPFIAVHLVAIVGAMLVPPTWPLVAACAASYAIRMWGVTAGYHRYFSHRTFKTSRVFQALLAVVAESSAQKGALWWAAHHRHHHKHSDEPTDVHSVKQRGFVWAHVAWILTKRWERRMDENIRDLLRFPELVWLDRWHLLPAVALAVVMALVGGLPLLVWGFFVSTVLLWHGTFTINSLAHVFGSRRFPTTDDSRNNWLLAMLTHGEGWHNNHHHYQSSANQGFAWWEWDPTFWSLVVLEKLGVVWDVRRPPAAVLAGVR